MHPTMQPGQMRMTERQLELYSYLCSFTEENGFQPSYKDMGGHMGSVSQNAIACHLKAIEKKGYIRIDRRRSRGIAFVGGD